MPPSARLSAGDQMARSFSGDRRQPRWRGIESAFWPCSLQNLPRALPASWAACRLLARLPVSRPGLDVTPKARAGAGALMASSFAFHQFWPLNLRRDQSAWSRPVTCQHQLRLPSLAFLTGPPLSSLEWTTLSAIPLSALLGPSMSAGQAITASRGWGKARLDWPRPWADRPQGFPKSSRIHIGPANGPDPGLASRHLSITGPRSRLGGSTSLCPDPPFPVTDWHSPGPVPGLRRGGP